MSIHPIMQKLSAKLERTDLPEFAPGDTVRVQVKIREGEKERLQAFEGMVIACNKGAQGSFTVRKMSFGQGVERIFPYNSKVVDKSRRFGRTRFAVRNYSTYAVCAARLPVCARWSARRSKESQDSQFSTEPRLRSWLRFARRLYTRMEAAWPPRFPTLALSGKLPQLRQNSGC